MTPRDLNDLKRVLQAMPLDTLRDAKRLVSDELDARLGKRKFQPAKSWDDMERR